MKTAFAAWKDRIAPVFDVAPQICLIGSGNRAATGEFFDMRQDDDPACRVLQLVELGAKTLVCGAISRPIMTIAQGYGIDVIPFVSGSLEEVIRAWRTGCLDHADYAMPGCRGRNYDHARGGRNTIGKEALMVQQDKSGQGRGRGQGRMGGRKAAGPAGTCVCPKCGHIIAHERGTPCTQIICPKCGGRMTRE